MILAIDVHYTENEAVAAGVTFDDWSDTAAKGLYISKISPVHRYIPGEFYKRELPCIDALLKEHHLEPDTIVVDGYVLLDDDKKGLGYYLYTHLNSSTTVIGVAKNPFRNIPDHCKLYRGESTKPLYITSVGIPQKEAKEHIGSMDGEYRFPTLLKLVDSICRHPKEHQQTPYS